MNVSNITNSLTKIIRDAGKIMLGANKNRDFDSKAGTANFVTAYDVAVQDFLIKSIKDILPEAVFMAEEKENDTAVLFEKYCFIIDPIDGTTNFIHDYRHSSISVAMLCGGETVLGMVYDPYLDELFTAEKGKGAYLNGEAIRVSKNPMELAVVQIGSCPYYKDEFADKTFALTKELFFKASDFRRSGSAALDLAYLASGRCDIFFEFRLSPWDFAAGELLVTEAGGIVTKSDGTKTARAAPCPIFASNGIVHEELIEMAKGYI